MSKRCPECDSGDINRVGKYSTCRDCGHTFRTGVNQQAQDRYHW